MRAALYIRVSTEEQSKDGFSLDAQLSFLKRKCEEWEYTIAGTYIDDGLSAKNMNRKALQQIFTDAENKQFDVVVYWRLDRLTRSSKDFHKLVERLNHNQVGIKSATEQIDTTTAIGRFQLELSVSLAQLERETISERVSFVMQELVREGKWHGGPVPFGYSWDGETMTIVEDEAISLREMRRVYMSGEGYGATANILNATGYLRNGKNWSVLTVGYALDNPFYAGKIRYGGKKKNGKYANRKKETLVDVIWSDSGFPQIFTWEEYEEHVARMKKREFYGSSKRREYWFSGVMRCGRCGNKLFGRVYGNKRNDNTLTTSVNYLCNGRSTRSGCDLPLLKQSLAESMIMDYIRTINVSRSELNESAKKVEKEKKNTDKEVEQMRKGLREIAERRKKWQYMLADNLMSESDFRQRKREEDEKERILLERIEELKAEDIGISSTFSQLMYALPDVWHGLDDGTKKEMMQTIFHSIVFECDVKSGLHSGNKPLPFRITEVNFN